MRRLLITMLLGGSAVTTGCETFTPPTQIKGVPSGHAMLVDTVATRRGTYFVKSQPSGASSERWLMVAEPPPDAALASVVKAAAEIAAKTPAGVDATGKGSLDVTQQITKLVERTQAITILRDGLFRLAEAYANGTISPEQYVNGYNKALSAATDIATAELRKAEAEKARAKTESTRTTLEALETIREMKINVLESPGRSPRNELLDAFEASLLQQLRQDAAPTPPES